MRTENTFSSILVSVLLTSCCASPAVRPAPSPVPVASSTPSEEQIACNAAEADLNATLWIQTSAEYQATSEQTYRWGKTMLLEALKDPAWTAAVEQNSVAGKPPAVILDIDETALDNTAYQGRLLKAHELHSEENFTAFRNEQISRPIAGAVDFCNFAREHHVQVFFTTNQRAPEEAIRGNLAKVGFQLDPTEDTVLLSRERPEWDSSDKTARRRFIAEKYRVILQFGDDFNDFVAAGGKSVADRAALLDRYHANFGTKWFMLANPIYGSWERAVLGNRPGLSRCEQIQIKNEALRTGM